MGILAEPLQYIRDLALPKGFSVIELGDQYITTGERRLASEFYRKLGCGVYESIDGNGRATRTADLNRPLDKQGLWLSGFDLVTDFGTGEHVFDQRQVWQTIHGLVRKDGYVVFDRPSAGYEGHCFWLMQPCVIAAFAWANGYEVVQFARAKTSRGELVRGVLRKRRDAKFVVPQQGRYHKDLKAILGKKERQRGPDYKVKQFRAAGLFGPALGVVEDDST